MKITTGELKKIIVEELKKALSENELVQNPELPQFTAQHFEGMNIPVVMKGGLPLVTLNANTPEEAVYDLESAGFDPPGGGQITAKKVGKNQFLIKVVA